MPFAKRLEECLTARLEAARTQGLLRSSATCLDGAFGNSNSAYPVSFMSNDYLGLARDAEQKKLVAKAFARGRTSASASRLAGGQTSERQRCEEDIAVFFGHEKATLFPCGFMANQAIVSALVARDQTVFADKSMHASTMRALAATHCRLAGFRHLDLEHLERRLRKAAGPRQPIVFTESVFSMDGACADVDGLMELKKKYDFFLVADEAHAVGVLGADGRGCFWQKGADVVIGTFGKALGFFGAVVLSTTTIAAALENFAPQLVYSTALPDSHAICCRDIVLRLPLLGDLRRRLGQNQALLQKKMQEAGLETSGGGHIVCVPQGSETKASTAQTRLRERGFLLLAARWPTVPPGEAALRISLTARHTEDELCGLAVALKDVLEAD